MGKVKRVKWTKEDVKLNEDKFVQIFSAIYPGIKFVDHRIVHPEPVKKKAKKK